MPATISLSQLFVIFIIVAIVFAVVAVITYGFANIANDISKRTEEILEKISAISFALLVLWSAMFVLVVALPHSLKKMKEAVTLPVRTGMHP
jgi:uncharacterized membrane-anchored protein